MYEAAYGLTEKPFSLIPDPRFLYFSRNHRMAFSLLEYGLSDQTGYVVISGEVGSGKTTLVRQLLNTAGREVTVGLITNTHRSFGEVLKWILAAFDLKTRARDKVGRFQAFMSFLIDEYAAGRRTVLIIDEAQNLGTDALEELRMLTNVNAERDYLLQLILCGQPELRDKLRRPELRQFVQRISLYHHLEPLGLEDTIAYIRHRLAVAGGDPGLFEHAACAAIHRYAGGTPRLINVLCDLALVYAFAEEKPGVDLDLVLDVVRARQGAGLDAFQADPDGMSREDVRRAVLRSVADIAAVSSGSAEGPV